MSESESDTEAEFESKEAFFEAVRDSGAVLGEHEYFTEGSGSATSYKVRTDDGEVEDVKKADVEAAWEEFHGDSSDDRDLARGHALLCGRDEIEMEDVEVCARVALSTMPNERRGIVRAVVDPATDNEITTSEIVGHDATDASWKTIIDRMYLLDDLEIGAMLEADSGRGIKKLALYDEFVWPDQLPFPRR